MIVRAFVILGLLSTAGARAGNESSPLGEPALEAPTLHCLGAYWIIKGDDNRNAKVEVSYRKAGTPEWHKGAPLFRVEKDHQNGAVTREKHKSQLSVPPDAWLFAGSIVELVPGTDYEIRLSLSDPDGGTGERTLKSRTREEPIAPKGAPVRHVVPGSGGGSGSESDPFKGLAAAQNAARPGDILLLHAGTYDGPFTFNKSGEPGKPIIWRGAGDGAAIIDGKQLKLEEMKGAIVELGNTHDVWLENVAIRNGYNLIRAHGASRLVVRRCHFSNGICGIFAVGTESVQRDFFISDNLMEGFMPWPCTPEQYGASPESRAVWINGTGHVVCYNRIHHFKDGPDVGVGPVCAAIDFHNNDISECFDDGAEMDFSERNTRCFNNRITNVFQGISVQPVFGGPVYVFRNVLYNVQVETFKMHSVPSGAIMYHNTALRTEQPLLLSTGDKCYNCVFRNNLFVGTSGRAFHNDAPMVNCDFDYNGYAGWSGDVFYKWNNIKYATLDELKAKAPVDKHALSLDAATLFEAGTKAPGDNKKIYASSVVDVRLKQGTPAIDAGEVLPGFNDGFTGKAPDLGAIEYGTAAPHYGPRPQK